MYTPPKKKGPRTKKPVIFGKMRLRIGDLVRVIAGKDKGKEGTITKVMRNDGKVVVEGINIMIKHIKPRPQAHQNTMGGSTPDGGRTELAAPIAACKVQLVDPADSARVTRIGMTRKSDGTVTRIARKSRSEIENA